MDVEIFGNTYDVKGDADSSHIKSLAAYLDKKMKEVAQNTSTISSLKIAILAALNIADDHFSLQEDFSLKVAAVNKRASILLSMVEKEMGQECPP